MKKTRIYFIIIFIIMIIPFLYKMSIKHHEKTYKVNSYQVKEVFYVYENKHYYDFVIQKGKNSYTYTIEQNMNKRPKVIKKIKTMKQNNITCIVPVYKKNIKKDIYCLEGKQQVSKEIIKNRTDFQKILKKVKKDNISLPKEYNQKEEYKKITIYNKNIPSNHTLVIWNYRGIIIIKKNKHYYKKFIQYDLYDNVMATTTSKDFVLFENTSVNGIEKVHCYDMIKDKYKTIRLTEKVSKNSYINGVRNNLIYITDPKKKKQYTLNVNKEELKEIGNEEIDFVFYINDKKEIISKKDFLKEQQLFDNNKAYNKKITTEELVKENHYYYFKENNSFFKQMDNTNKILLFHQDEIGEWSIYNQEWLLKREDELWFYSDQEGLKKLIEYNELKYNNNRIYYIWKKEK